MPRNPVKELRRRRRRRNKTRFLKARLDKTDNPDQKKKILIKLQKVNPFLRLSG